MAGTAKGYSSTKLMIGPGDAWGNLALPADGSRLTLHTDLTPDSTANPSAKHVGFTDQGTKVMYRAEIQTFEADEQTAPILSRILTESLKIEGAFLQGADFDIMDMFLMGATKTSAAGYEQITLGGNTAVTGISFAVIVPTVADATKAHVFNIYSAYNEAGLDLAITRRDISKIPFTMTGLQLSSRTAGNRLGNIWSQT